MRAKWTGKCLINSMVVEKIDDAIISPLQSDVICHCFDFSICEKRTISASRLPNCQVPITPFMHAVNKGLNQLRIGVGRRIQGGIHEHEVRVNDDGEIFLL